MKFIIMLNTMITKVGQALWSYILKENRLAIQIKAEDYKGALIEIGKPCPPRCDGTKIKGKDIW
jgi:hypothetical protein